MKKKFLTFLLATLFVLPCMFILAACGGGGNGQVWITRVDTDHVTLTYGETFSLNAFNARLVYSDGTEEPLALEGEEIPEDLSFEIHFTAADAEGDPENNFEVPYSIIDEIPECPDAGLYEVNIHFVIGSRNHQTQVFLTVNQAVPENAPGVQMTSQEFAYGDNAPAVSLTAQFDMEYCFEYAQADGEGHIIMETDDYGNSNARFSSSWEYEAGDPITLTPGQYALYAVFESQGNYCSFKTEPIFFTVTKAEFDASYELCKIEYDDGDPMYVPSTEITIKFQPGQTTLGQSNIGLDICKEGEWVIGSKLVWEHPEKSIDDLGATENVVMKKDNFEDKIVAVSITLEKWNVNMPLSPYLYQVGGDQTPLGTEVIYDGTEYAIDFSGTEQRGTGENYWTFYTNYYDPQTEESTPVALFRAIAAPTSTFSATNAGDYSITFELIDKVHTLWSEAQNTENYVVNWSILPIPCTSSFCFVIDGNQHGFAPEANIDNVIVLDYKDSYSVSVVETTSGEVPEEINHGATNLSLQEYEQSPIDGIVTLTDGTLSSTQICKTFILYAEIPQPANHARVFGYAVITIGSKVFTQAEKDALDAEATAQVPSLAYHIASANINGDNLEIEVPAGLVPTATALSGEWHLYASEESISRLNAGDTYTCAYNGEQVPICLTWFLKFYPNTDSQNGGDDKYSDEYYYSVPLSIEIDSIGSQE